MKRYNTARPITAVDALHAAVEAGARLEFTACGPGAWEEDGAAPDSYDDPPSHLDKASGWVPVAPESAASLLAHPQPGFLFRAFYPITEMEPA